MNKKLIIVATILMSNFFVQIVGMDPGTLDTTFNPGGSQPGTLSTTVSNQGSLARGVAIQSDGKIVSVGNAVVSGVNQFAIVRYNNDGSLDTSFNGTGIATITIAGENIDAIAHAVVIQDDGKIVVAGQAIVGGINQFALARFNTNGTLDTSTFNTGGAQPGTAVINISGATNSFGQSVALESDGSIVIAGRADVAGITQFAIARFTTSGTIDTTFNGTGNNATTVENGDINIGYSVAIASDGKAIVAGHARIGGIFRFGLARFNTNGTLDTTTFNSGGVQPGTASTDIESGNPNVGLSVALQNDGKIVVGGHALIGGIFRFVLTRFTSTGILDTTFSNAGQAGTVSTTIENSMSNIGQAIAIQDNNKIIIVGYAVVSGINQFGVAQFTADGILDSTIFNTSGVQPGTSATTVNNSNENLGLAVALQSDGKIVIVGSALINGINEFAAARFWGDFVPVINNPCIVKFINKYRPTFFN